MSAFTVGFLSIPLIPVGTPAAPFAVQSITTLAITRLIVNLVGVISGDKA